MAQPPTPVPVPPVAPETPPVVPPVAPAPGPETPPAAPAPEAPPVAPPTPEVPPPTPAAETPPAAEPPKTEAKADDPTAQLTLLEAFDKKKAEEKPVVEEKPAPEVKAEDKPAAEDKVETPVPEAAKPEPVKYEFKLPEHVTMNDEQSGKLQTVLNDLHTAPTPENTQKLIDLHFEGVQEALNGYDAYTRKIFADQRAAWGKDVMADPNIGGANHDEAMQAIAYVRDNFVSLEPRGSKEYEAAKAGFDQALHYTGMGDNPWFLRFVHNVSTVLNEPQMQATADVRLVGQTEVRGRAPIYKTSTRR